MDHDQILRIERWTEMYPVGTRVRYWPIRHDVGDMEAEHYDCRTRSGPWLLGGHTVVMQISGWSGCVALAHLEVLRETEASTE